MSNLIAKGLKIAAKDIKEGDFVRLKFEDQVEPEVFFWWYAKATENWGVLCLQQLDFDYEKNEDNCIYPAESYEGYEIELLQNEN